MKKCMFIVFLILGVVGCNQQDVVDFNSDSTLTVKERVENNDDFQLINEVEDEDKVRMIIDIFNNVNWDTDTHRDMPLPHYRLNNYDIWVTPSGDMLEIINQSNDYYVRLSKENSEVLFEIITGKELKSR
ncbi:hypothetical protein [Gracilibacillus sp. YIM 98692]|uniref:hypothetical protein n=1 Tax=Gracilibacillus sp. YIM 98692 TaxID=2663532 RepID=UPI0013D44953|nr:hypothetical protein [Gracilibacillus sp. YIM 98692]